MGPTACILLHHLDNPRPHKDHDNKVEVHGDIKKVEFEVEARKPEEIYDESEVTPTEFEHTLASDRPRRQTRPPQRYDDFVAFALNMAESIDDEQEPSSFHEAVTCDEASQWIGAMKEELESLHKNHTWKLVEKPIDQKIVGCKWIYKKKDGIRFKARLVAKGFTQRKGIDFNEVFSPVVKHSSIRVLLALVSLLDLELEQLDVKTAFLHGDLEETIYMQQPDGFVVPGKEDHVCLLKKSLYGLKQSPRQWYKRFDSFMIDIRYIKSEYDSCVYHTKLFDNTYIYLLLYVDDMLIACKHPNEINKVKTQLSGEFEMKDLGPAKRILGMEIIRDRKIGRLCLSQKSYVEKVLERFGMHNAKAVSTPFAAHFKLSANMSPQTKEEE